MHFQSSPGAIVLLICWLVLQTSVAQAQARGDNWLALSRLEKQLRGAEPQIAIDAYRELFDSRPKMLPAVAIRLTLKVADIYAFQL